MEWVDQNLQSDCLFSLCSLSNQAADWSKSTKLHPLLLCVCTFNKDKLLKAHCTPIYLLHLNPADLQALSTCWQGGSAWESLSLLGLQKGDERLTERWSLTSNSLTPRVCIISLAIQHSFLLAFFCTHYSSPIATLKKKKKTNAFQLK